MKKVMFVVLLSAGMMGAVARAQTDAPAAPVAPVTQGPASPRQMPSPDKIVAMMAMKLNLTAEQQQKITPIVAARQEKMQSIRADTSSRPMQKMKKMKEATEDADKQINAILTPDQRTQYAAFEAERRQEMQERRQEQKSGAN